MDERPDIRIVKVRSFGWLRRPELDHPGAEAWERPDGMLDAYPAGQGEPSVAIRRQVVARTAIMEAANDGIGLSRSCR
jgi:hypothetical protein